MDHSSQSRSRKKIQSWSVLQRLRRRAATAGRTVVLTNGCFDLIHAGHVALLEQAKRQGDLLIVGINSDRSVRQLKGRNRPIVSQRNRATVLAALESVDYVTIFDEPTPEQLIAALKPDVLIKGADWRLGQIIGREVVQRRGGRVMRLPLVKGLSTSALIQRILSTVPSDGKHPPQRP